MFFERPQSGERAVLVHLELGGGGAQEDPRELEELVLHGTLHLLGHDHEQDDGEMEDLELRLREELLG